MNHEPTHVTEEAIHQAAIRWLAERSVRLDDIVDLVYTLQKEYYPDLTPDECRNHLEHVLKKREVQNTILTGIQLDRLAEERKLAEPLLNMVLRDENLYGVDEVLATSILHVYGSIGMTNYGYIDRVKPGVLQHLDNKESGCVHTFLDDMVGALAASSIARLVHNRKHRADQEKT